MKRIALPILVCSALAVGSTAAAPVTGWIDRQAPGSTMVLTGAETASPTMGDGSSGNAQARSIYAPIPAVSLAEIGHSVSLTGTAALSGVTNAGNQFRFGLFDTNGSSSDLGWLGYAQGNGASGGGGILYERINPNTSWYFSTPNSANTIATSSAPNMALSDGTYAFALTIMRVASGLQIDATLTRTSDSQLFASTSILDTTISTSTFNRVALLSGGGMEANQIRFSDIDVTFDDTPPPPPPPPLPPMAALGPPLLGIDFNRTDALGSPSQSLFRKVGGSATQADNASSYTKSFGPRQVTIRQPGGVNFEFRGGNSDNSRAIPGGDTSLSFLVADFIASREGAIDLEITGLEAGDYIFRSWHLDSLTTGPLGFAQGATTTTPNTIEASIGGELQGTIQGTSLGFSGLGTTFIEDRQIPRIEFGFSHDGGPALTIELRSLFPSGGNNHLLLNGFALYPATP